jgi:hypothetical protein
MSLGSCSELRTPRLVHDLRYIAQSNQVGAHDCGTSSDLDVNHLGVRGLLGLARLEHHYSYSLLHRRPTKTAIIRTFIQMIDLRLIHQPHYIIIYN